MSKLSLQCMILAAPIIGLSLVALGGKTPEQPQPKEQPFIRVDTSNIRSETMHDYPKMDLLTAYSECLKKSVVEGDNWQITDKKCGEDLLTNLCLSMNLPAGKMYALSTLSTGESLDLRCIKFQSQMVDAVTAHVGSQQQKDDRKTANPNAEKVATDPNEVENNPKAFSSQSAQKNLWKYYYQCLLQEIGKGESNQIVFNRCLDIGIAWCNASNMPTSQNPAFSDVTHRPNIDNAQCSNNLQTYYQAAQQAFQSEYQNYSASEAVGMPYRPIAFDIRKYGSK